MDTIRPRISVIMPVYNGEQVLEKAVRSVLCQGFSDFELLAVDDGSTDGSLSLLRRLENEDQRLRVISRENGGPSAARNLGIDEAAGEYLFFIDCDDVIEPDAFGTMLSLCKTDTPDMVFCGYAKDTERDGAVVSSKVYTGEPQMAAAPEEFGRMLPNLLEHRLQSCMGNKLYRRAFVGGERFDPSVKVHEDALFHFSLYRRIGSAAVCGQVLYHYLQREGESGVRRFVEERIGWLDRVARETIELFQQYGVFRQNARMVYDNLLHHVILCAEAILSPLCPYPPREKNACLRRLTTLPVVRQTLRELTGLPFKRELIRRVLATGSPFLIKLFFKLK